MSKRVNNFKGKKSKRNGPSTLEEMEEQQARIKRSEERQRKASAAARERRENG